MCTDVSSVVKRYLASAIVVGCCLHTAPAQVVRLAPIITHPPTEYADTRVPGVVPPDSQAHVDVGETFYVELWATNTDEPLDGLACVYVDLVCDSPDLIDPVEPVQSSPLFPIDAVAAVFNHPGGAIGDVGGCQTAPPIYSLGVDEWVMVKRIEMIAVAPGDGVTISLHDADSIYCGISILGYPYPIYPEQVEFQTRAFDVGEPDMPAPPVLPMDDTHKAPKNRYVSIDPTTNGLSEVAYEIRAESTMLPKWIGDPYVADCDPQFDCDDQWFATLVDDAVFRVWSEDTLHVHGCRVIPVMTYEIRACAPPNGTPCSEPLTIGTIQKPHVYYADVCGGAMGSPPAFTPPDGYVNVTDVSGYLFAVKGYPGAPHTTWVDLHGVSQTICEPPDIACVVPQQIVNVGDLSTIKFGFKGYTYTQTPGQVDPGSCP